MKCARLALLLAVAAAFVLSSCKDEQLPTTPTEVLSPQYSLTQEDIEELVEDLIGQMFPDKTLGRSAERRWSNIQRMWNQGKEEEASIQAMEFAAWLPVRLAEDQLADPTVDCEDVGDFCGLLYPEASDPLSLTLTAA